MLVLVWEGLGPSPESPEKGLRKQYEHGHGEGVSLLSPEVCKASPDSQTSNLGSGDQNRTGNKRIPQWV